MGARLLDCVGSLLLCGFCSTAAAQESAVVDFYHGARGDSQLLRYDVGKGPVATSVVRLALQVDAGGEVTIRLPNWNPHLYAYSLDVKVDSSSNQLPSILDALGRAIKAEDSLRRGRQLEKQSIGPQPVLETYLDAVTGLHDSIARAERLLRESDLPEPREDALRETTTSRRGYRFAAETILGWPTERLAFNDPELEGNLKHLIDPFAMAGDSLIAEVLQSHAAVLVQERDRARAAASHPRTGVMRQVVGDLPTTIRLKVQPRGTNPVRDTGDEVMVLKVVPRFHHQPFATAPVVLTGYAGRRRGYAIRDGALARSEDRESVRPVGVGAALVLNLVQFGEADEWACGPALAVGLVGNNDLVAHMVPALMVSYRDIFRLGLGVGLARLPDRPMEGLAVGQPVVGAADVTALLEEDWRGAVYVLLSTQGFGMGGGASP